MARVRKQNFFNTTLAVVKFVLFWVLVAVQLPIILLLPRGRASVWYMGRFMRILLSLCGVRVRVHGRLVDHRPLMVVCNHISVFEIAIFPAMFGGSFVAKKEVESWPLVGWVAKKFGVIFVDRRPSHAADALRIVQETVRNAPYPMFLFPEAQPQTVPMFASLKAHCLISLKIPMWRFSLWLCAIGIKMVM